MGNNREAREDIIPSSKSPVQISIPIPDFIRPAPESFRPMLPKPQRFTVQSTLRSLLKTFTLLRRRLAAWATPRQVLARLGRVLAILPLALLLCSCVNYDVGVNFKNQHSGEIVQTIKLDARLAAINGTSAQQWLDSLEQRARQLQGKTLRPSSQELQVKIPFTTSKDFVQKFNRFFAGQSTSSDLSGDAAIASHLSLQQANALLLLRSHLVLDVDLHSLGIASENEGIIVNPGNLLTLDFRLNTPWGSQDKLRGASAIPGESYPGGMVWHLHPGQLNHIEAYFWLPSPLGLGSLAVVGLVLGGTWLKQKLLQRQAQAAITGETTGEIAPGVSPLGSSSPAVIPEDTTA